MTVCNVRRFLFFLLLSNPVRNTFFAQNNLKISPWWYWHAFVHWNLITIVMSVQIGVWNKNLNLTEFVFYSFSQQPLITFKSTRFIWLHPHGYWNANCFVLFSILWLDLKPVKPKSQFLKLPTCEYFFNATNIKKGIFFQANR